MFIKSKNFKKLVQIDRSDYITMFKFKKYMIMDYIYF